MQYATWFTEAVGTVKPGDDIETELILGYTPENPYSHFVPGARFGIYEGNRKVATGTILTRFTRTALEWTRIYQERLHRKNDHA